MDAEKTLKKYILRGWMKTVGLVLCAAMLVLLVMGITAMGAANNDAAEFYPSESENGTMAYIDVVGVSDWLYQYDEATYYSALDAEGYLYTVRLSDSQFKDLKAQFDYFMSEDENAPVPEAYRLVGYVQNTPSNVRTNLAQVWEITQTDYDNYFGTKFLNATTSTGEQASAPWFVGALFCFLFAVVFLLTYHQSSKVAKKCLQRLEELGLTERAAQQLENAECNTVIGKNKGMLSQEFVFGKGTGMVVPYSDILWCYQQDRKRNFVPVNSYLMIGTMATAVVAAVELGHNDKQGIIAGALMAIAQRNPNTIVGYSRENANSFSALRKGK